MKSIGTSLPPFSSFNLLCVLIELNRKPGEHMLIVVWRNFPTISSILHMFDNSVSFLMECMNKGDLIDGYQ